MCDGMHSFYYNSEPLIRIVDKYSTVQYSTVQYSTQAYNDKPVFCSKGPVVY